MDIQKLFCIIGLISILLSSCNKPDNDGMRGSLFGGGGDGPISEESKAILCNGALNAASGTAARGDGSQTGIDLVISGGQAPYSIQDQTGVRAFNSRMTVYRTFVNESAANIQVDGAINGWDSKNTPFVCSYQITVLPQTGAPFTIARLVAAPSSPKATDNVTFTFEVSGGTPPYTAFFTSNYLCDSELGCDRTLSNPQISGTSGTFRAVYFHGGQKNIFLTVRDLNRNETTISKVIFVASD
ncbi:MAG: hypothetical protein HY537_08830 [Deltaproteobacteria bacterium]|nr:hypothetical protein [Deltaproteobacteria bacterium]